MSSIETRIIQGEKIQVISANGSVIYLDIDSNGTATFANGLTVTAGDLKVAGSANIDGGTLDLGVNDTTRGTFNIYGSATTGGRLALYNGADDDTSFEYWMVQSQDSGGNFVIFREGIDTPFSLSATDGSATFSNGINVTTGDTTIDAVLNISVANTVANLPTPTEGKVARVNDANTPSMGSTVVGGGSSSALVWYNGSNWTVIGV